MFGQHDDDEKKDEAAKDEPGNPDIGTAPTDDSQPSDDTANQDWQHPGTPLDDNDIGDATTGDEVKPDNQTSPVITPDDNNSDDQPAPQELSHPAPEPPANVADGLIDIKQEALGKLTPLIGHLEQSPEDKFRTLMMMIQASDDQSLVKQAYETAGNIEDEKTRAQALLDIVNEINYFTQNPTKTE